MSGTERKKQWGDLDDDDEDNREAQDANGLIERVRFGVNSKGQKVKTTTKVRVVELKNRIPKRVEMRKNLPRFGDARIGEENVTNVSRDTVAIEHPDDQLVEDVDDPSLQKTLANFVKKQQETKARWEMEADEEFNRNEGADDGGASATGAKSDKYVPPGAKMGAGSGLSKLENLADREVTENTIRVTNLTKAATQDDLRELFGRFGRINRVSLPHVERIENGKTIKEPRGFAFIAFWNREDAELAMEKLQGHPYHHLILKLEWASPTQGTKPSGPGGLSSSYVSGYGTKLAQDTNEKGVVFASSKYVGGGQYK